MVVEIEQPGVEGPVRQLGVPVKLARTPGEHARLPGPALGEHTEAVLLAAGYSEAEVAELLSAARPPGRPSAAGASRTGARAVARRGMSARRPRRRQRELLKMSELAERSGVSPGTIRYYLREGLLGDGEDIVRTSRNMAYYPPHYVERIALIKRLQEERFMPLRVIRGALREDPERVRALIELEDRILERALASAEERSARLEKAVRERYGVPAQRARAPGGDRRADARPGAARL